jgi:hypothetical protein
MKDLVIWLGVVYLIFTGSLLVLDWLAARWERKQ